MQLTPYDYETVSVHRGRHWTDAVDRMLSAPYERERQRTRDNADANQATYNARIRARDRRNPERMRG